MNRKWKRENFQMLEIKNINLLIFTNLTEIINKKIKENTKSLLKFRKKCRR